jgi:hypothetical protein
MIGTLLLGKQANNYQKNILSDEYKRANRIRQNQRNQKLRTKNEIIKYDEKPLPKERFIKIGKNAEKWKTNRFSEARRRGTNQQLKIGCNP